MSFPTEGNRERALAQGESDETEDFYINGGFYDAVTNRARLREKQAQPFSWGWVSSLFQDHSRFQTR
jgi:hypothetical protein